MGQRRPLKAAAWEDWAAAAHGGYATKEQVVTTPRGEGGGWIAA